MSPHARQTAQRIHAIYWQLALIENLELNEHTFQLVQELLQLLSFRHFGKDTTALMNDPVLGAIAANLRRIFSECSFLYEFKNAQDLLAETDVLKTLTEEHPYYQHYLRASTIEFQLASNFLNSTPQRILFAGSGPLPLTSIVMTRSFGIPIHNIDIVPQANQIAQKIATRLELTKQLTFSTTDVADFEDLYQFDLVWLAALAGDERNKRRILLHLARNMRPGAVLVVRTAAQLRTFLYPPVQADDFIGFDLKLGVQPYTDSYHSVFIAQRPDTH